MTRPSAKALAGAGGLLHQPANFLCYSLGNLNSLALRSRKDLHLPQNPACPARQALGEALFCVCFPTS